MRLPRAIAIAFALAACGPGDGGLDRFEIQFGLDERCAAGSCSEFPLACGAVVSVRLLDSLDLEGNDPEPRAFECVRVADLESNTLCDAGNVSIEFTDVPRERGMIEVVIWPHQNGDGEPECPEVAFDAAGRPNPGPDDPEPAFARRQFFDFAGGDGEVAQIELDCWRPDLIENADCSIDETFVSAFITDMATLVSVNEGAEQLSVSIGEPTDDGNGAVEIVPGQTNRLAFVRPDIFAPRYEATVSRTFEPGDDVCVLVLADVFVPETVHCQPAMPTPPNNSGRESLDLQGFVIAGIELQRILDAVGLEQPPPEGMVIGRVVRDLNAPMDGVTVMPQVDESPPQIFYLNEDLSSTDGLIATSTSGYFVALGVPYGTDWEATRPGGWHAPLNPKPRAGNITGRITALILRMSQD